MPPDGVVATGMSGPRRRVHPIETSRSPLRFPCSRATNDTQVDKEMPPDGVVASKQGCQGHAGGFILETQSVTISAVGMTNQPGEGFSPSRSPGADIYRFL
jgi:hypothetical protein